MVATRQTSPAANAAAPREPRARNSAELADIISGAYRGNIIRTPMDGGMLTEMGTAFRPPFQTADAALQHLVNTQNAGRPGRETLLDTTLRDRPTSGGYYRLLQAIREAGRNRRFR